MIFPEGLSKLQQRQINELNYEKLLRSKIPAVGGINDSISMQIQEQYESHPYPRWTCNVVRPTQNSLYDFVKASKLSVDLNSLPRSKDIRTMIAGCGTGQQILSSINSFHSSSILAFDLSISSLAYARRKIEELDIHNVESKQEHTKSTSSKRSL